MSSTSGSTPGSTSSNTSSSTPSGTPGNSMGHQPTHAGTVMFADGKYQVACGTGNWSVDNIPPPGVPAGQVLVSFNSPLVGPYSVLVTAQRTMDAPMLCANWGDATADNFVVVLFSPVGHPAYTTVRNGGFSFLVMK